MCLLPSKKMTFANGENVNVYSRNVGYNDQSAFWCTNGLTEEEQQWVMPILFDNDLTISTEDLDYLWDAKGSPSSSESPPSCRGSVDMDFDEYESPITEKQQINNEDTNETVKHSLKRSCPDVDNDQPISQNKKLKIHTEEHGFVKNFSNDQLLEILLKTTRGEFDPQIPEQRSASPIPIATTTDDQDANPKMFLIGRGGRPSQKQEQKQPLISVKFDDFRHANTWWSRVHPQFGLVCRKLRETPRKTKSGIFRDKKRFSYKLQGCLVSLIRKPTGDVPLRNTVVREAARFLEYRSILKSKNVF